MLYKQRFSLEEWTEIERALNGEEITVDGETYEAAKIHVDRGQMSAFQQEQQRLKENNSNGKVLMQIGAAGSGLIALITAFAIKGYKKTG
jgi:hypothetical protein